MRHAVLYYDNETTHSRTPSQSSLLRALLHYCIIDKRRYQRPSDKPAFATMLGKCDVSVGGGTSLVVKLAVFAEFVPVFVVNLAHCFSHAFPCRRAREKRK